MNQRYANDIGSIGRSKISHNIFQQIVSLENLFLASREFRCGKRNKLDVQLFKLTWKIIFSKFGKN